jgi:hypothetical protein
MMSAAMHGRSVAGPGRLTGQRRRPISPILKTNNEDVVTGRTVGGDEVAGCQVDKSILTQRTAGWHGSRAAARRAAGSAAADSQTAAGSWTVMRQDEADLKGT